MDPFDIQLDEVEAMLGTDWFYEEAIGNEENFLHAHRTAPTDTDPPSLGNTTEEAVVHLRYSLGQLAQLAVRLARWKTVYSISNEAVSHLLSANGINFPVKGYHVIKAKRNIHDISLRMVPVKGYTKTSRANLT